MDLESVIKFAEDSLIEYRLQEPLSKHTSFKIGGPASVMLFPATEEKAEKLLSFLGENVFVLGNGSNLLVSDKGIFRPVVKMGAVDFLSSEGKRITAGAGCSLARLASFALENSLSGLEFAHGIPGTVGGGVYMNAGAYGGELSQCVESVKCFSPQRGVFTLSAEELKFGYRKSVFSENKDWTVLSATFLLSFGSTEQIKSQMTDLMVRRKSKQPLEFPSAGSFFKRPEGYFAAALIEEAGLKGFSVGDAAVSEKHSGFVVNKGKATFAQVITLAEAVKNTVLEKYGVLLEPEVKIIDGEL